MKNIIVFHQNEDGLIQFLQQCTNFRRAQDWEYFYPGQNVVTIINDESYHYIKLDKFADYSAEHVKGLSDCQVIFGDSDNLRIMLKEIQPPSQSEKLLQRFERLLQGMEKVLLLGLDVSCIDDLYEDAGILYRDLEEHLK